MFRGNMRYHGGSKFNVFTQATKNKILYIYISILVIEKLYTKGR
jgi:hypothetical protein